MSSNEEIHLWPEDKTAFTVIPGTNGDTPAIMLMWQGGDFSGVFVVDIDTAEELHESLGHALQCYPSKI